MDTEETIRTMLGDLRHRGPDDQGVWNSQKDGLWLGHRRLSVIDTTIGGHQPMASPDDALVLTYNGEIYNFEDLRDELEGAGHRFRSKSDSEVLLAAYAQWGKDLLHRLVGMFAFAIWDRKERKLFLARDRAGEKPLYYASGGGGFAFASEIQALHACPWVDGRVDDVALGQYLQYGYVPAPLSIYRGIRKLPPAHSMSVTTSGVEVERYWDPIEHALAPQHDFTDGEALEQLEHLLTEAVRLQLVSDVPLGAFLSGGVDSSLVVALMGAIGGRTVRTFTIGFDAPGFDESGPAGVVANHLGTHHTCHRLQMQDALEIADRIPSMFGEPFADPSALPTRMVAEVARRSVTVSLSGDGADELFGGYDVYSRVQGYARASRIARPFRTTLIPILSRAPGKLGRRASRLAEYASLDTDVSYRHYFTTPEVGRLLGRPFGAESQAETTWRETEGLEKRRQAMVTDFSTYLPEDVLTKVDRTAMSVSLETRAPFLDHRLVEWALRLPGRHVNGKALLKKLLSRHVPRALFDRPKQGFDVPIGRWFRVELRERLLEALSAENLTGLGIDGSELVDRLVREHLDGGANHDRRLWMLYTLSLWQHDDRSHRTGRS